MKEVRMINSRRIVAPVLAAAAVILLAPTGAPGAPVNPLLAPSTLPFQAPPFDKITDADYLPAFEEGMARQRREIAAIANDPSAPTFQNTVLAIEKSGRLLDRVNLDFAGVSQANTDPALQHVQDVIAPQEAALNDEIFLNPKLFARVKSVYDRRDSLHLDPESLQLLKVDYQQFVLAGAQLPAAKRAKLSAIDQQLATLQSTFDHKLLAADNRFNLQNTTQQPALATMSDRAAREKLFHESWTRTERGDANDTRSTIEEMAYLRAQRAALLGYPSYAAYALVDQMAKNPQTVQSFLHGLIPAERVKATQEAAQLQHLIDASGKHFTLEPWDWAYYENKLRQQKLNLDEKAIRPYFELNDVLHNGLFYAANRLYGITFKERHDIPVYNPDVRVFEVYDKNGAPLALMYFDFFKRPNKQGGAWMSTFVNQSKLFGTKPVVYNVENIPKGAPGQPTLLSIDNVVGMFHEFGHALNGFFADQEYESLSGAATARDFVEYPSQFNEHWALYPAVLKHYAYDYRTHKPMPKALFDKVEASRTFGGAYAFGELLAADELDMAWHSLPASAPKVSDVDAFETHALQASGTAFDAIPPRYRSSYFAHIWTSGYAAGYYAYTWSEMLDDDTFQWFLDHGGMTRANGQRFRDLILSRGHSEDYGPMFRSFYGKDPEVGPLLKARGLTTGSGG
jgi:peptidyl-dipeptidase Dcp